MKKLLTVIGVAALLATANAQTNSLPPAVSQSWSLFKPVLTASNWTVAPYATYAPKAPTQWGGGVLSVYNVNKFVGAGAGVDWLGEFNLFSGNVELKLPTHPLKFLNSQWAQDFTATPIAIGGLATALGGAGRDNGGLTTIVGAGLAVKVASAWGGNVDVGGLYSDWHNAGAYSVRHWHIFAAWHKPF